MTEREYLVTLYSFIPFGPARIKLLVSYFGSAKKAWSASSRELLKIGLKEKLVNSFMAFRHGFDEKGYFGSLRDKSTGFVTINDSDYPENLFGIDDAPPVLYIKGEIKPRDINAIAIVGSRKMTSYGREVTERFAGEIAGLGITVVSGLARGVDTVAHESALAAGGRTLAVLACGLDKIYPPENTTLAHRIVQKGALISEYPLGEPALRTNFASRNRLISGLSKAVVVVEGQEKSGTLLTASHAAGQGRTVFAVPGQITSPLSAAPHFLIQNGAKMVSSVKDILAELNLQLMVDRDKVETVLPGSQEEKTLLEILTNEPFHLDELARIAKIPVSEISARLTIMELKGMVRNMGGGVYKKV